MITPSPPHLKMEHNYLLYTFWTFIANLSKGLLGFLCRSVVFFFFILHERVCIKEENGTHLNIKRAFEFSVCLCVSPLTTTNCLFSLNRKKRRFCRENLQIRALRKLKGILLRSLKASQLLLPCLSQHLFANKGYHKKLQCGFKILIVLCQIKDYLHLSAKN